MSHQDLATEALEAYNRLTAYLEEGKNARGVKAGSPELNEFVYDFVLVGDVLSACGIEDPKEALEELEADRSYDPDVCTICGEKLNPNEIHAGIDECAICDPPRRQP